MVAIAVKDFIKDNWKELKERGPLGYIWEKNFEHTAPHFREEICFVELLEYNEKTQAFDELGILIQDRYEKANSKNGALREQIEYRKWCDQQKENNIDPNSDKAKATFKKQHPDIYAALFYPDGTKKSPLDLAIIQSSGDVKRRVDDVIRKDVKYHRDQKDPRYRVPLLGPSKSKLVFKETYMQEYLTAEEYAKKLNAGTLPPNAPKIVLKESPQSIMVNINNPHEKAPTREKILHAIGPWIAWLITLSMCAAAWAAPTLIHSIVFTIAAWIVNVSSNYADMFFKAKTLNRDIGWLSSKEFSWVKNFSKWNALKSAVKAGALMLAMQQAAIGAYTGTMAIGLFAAFPVLQFSAALFFGAVALVGAYVGLFDAMQYAQGFSLSDNNIPQNEFKSVIEARKTHGPKARNDDRFELSGSDEQFELSSSNEFTPAKNSQRTQKAKTPDRQQRPTKRKTANI